MSPGPARAARSVATRLRRGAVALGGRVAPLGDRLDPTRAVVLVFAGATVALAAPIALFGVNRLLDGDTVVVEGTSTGETADGTEWRPDGSPGGGRWCDVFEVRDGEIQRLFIYLDPDYAGKDTEQYPWL